MKTEKQKGFTLIELVVVIALLGILAAFAIPRFASLESEARSAVTQGLSGSIRSGAAMAHGLFVAGATPVVMEGNSITMVNGYPNAATIVDTLADVSGFDAPDLTTPGQVTIAKTGAPGACEVLYAEAGVNTPPTVSFSVGGC